jgi:alkaline phosphatase D
MDPELMAAQQAHPFLMVFDDHEVDNDWAGGISEENGGRAFPIAVPPELFALRKQAAFQAWWENMPLRRAVLPRGPEITAYRSLRFGQLARVHLLDTRSWRDDQPCGGNPVVVPACDAVARPDAQMLGAGQEKWLLDRVAEGNATWQVLAQQVMVMRRELPGGNLNMDKWDGAPAARERLLRGLQERRASNPVILTGDIHNAWVGDLRLNPLDERSPVIASEFVATSISSGGDGSEAVSGAEDILRRNPHIHFAHNRRGYSLHEATAQRMTVTHRALPFVTRAGAAQEDRGVFVVEAGKAGVVRG